MTDKAERQGALTLQDLADAVGVSRTTASNAFNRPDQLSAEMRDRILSAAREMGYPGPNPMARMLRTGKAGAIGLIFGDELPYAFNDPAAIAFLQGVAGVCQENDDAVLILPGRKATETRRAAVERAAVDGFILYAMPIGSALVERILEQRLPVVVVDQPSLGMLPSVTIDDRGAARQAMAHLTELGHRRLATISFELRPDGWAGFVGPERRAAAVFENTELRLRGYEDALAAAGIYVATAPVWECPENNEANGFAAAQRLLGLTPRPTGIVAMSDQLALGAMRAARGLGLSVPGDLSIVGFDDVPAAALAQPALTTIRQPLIDKGAVAARLLKRDPAAAPEQVLLPANLVVRASTGPAPAA